MKLTRRGFLKLSGSLAAATVVGTGGKADASQGPGVQEDSWACLVDTTLCVGCRKCEQACSERHGLAKPELPYDELTVLEEPRRPDEKFYTVINKYYPQHIGPLTWRERPSFVKFQCMHCNDPACASACITGALHKNPEGPITWTASKCIGCRYCMVACPFQIPAYEYNEPLTPRVMKCTFCYEYVKKGDLPACVKVCPMEVMTFGKRGQLLELARKKIADYPGKYVNYIYGEKEVGGTSWLYLASQPFEKIGFPKLGTLAPPRITEGIQHGIYKYLWAPLTLYVILGGVMWASGFFGEKKSFRVSKPGEMDERKGGSQ